MSRETPLKRILDDGIITPPGRGRLACRGQGSSPPATSPGSATSPRRTPPLSDGSAARGGCHHCSKVSPMPPPRFRLHTLMVARAFRLAVAFLTVIPVRLGDGEVTEADLAASRFAYPVVGIAIGLMLAAWSEALRLWGIGPAPAAFLLVAAGVAITGGLHLDGLADTGDGLFLRGDASRRLAVMCDPHVGSFGVTAIVLVLLGKYAALSHATGPGRSLAVLGAATVGRTLILVAAGSSRYARLDGTGRVLIGAATPSDAFVAASGTLAFGAAGRPSRAGRRGRRPRPRLGPDAIYLTQARRYHRGYSGGPGRVDGVGVPGDLAIRAHSGGQIVGWAVLRMTPMASFPSSMILSFARENVTRMSVTIGILGRFASRRTTAGVDNQRMSLLMRRGFGDDPGGSSGGKGACMGEMILVLGGSRSGKSRLAERLAGEAGPVTYVATAGRDDSDLEMVARIERHRANRPRDWATMEVPRGLESVLPGLVAREGAVVIDCLTLWVSNLILGLGGAALEDEAVLAAVDRAAAAAQGAGAGHLGLQRGRLGHRPGEPPGPAVRRRPGVGESAPGGRERRGPPLRGGALDPAQVSGGRSGTGSDSREGIT